MNPIEPIMVSKKDLAIFAVGIILVIVGLVYVNNSNSLFSSIADPILPVVWDEVKERDIVKNSFPITLLEENGDQCLLSSRVFGDVVSHDYFTQGDKFANEFQFDSENSTIIVPCKQLYGEKSRLDLWYVVPEADSHATKYEYWITPWK